MKNSLLRSCHHFYYKVKFSKGKRYWSVPMFAKNCTKDIVIQNDSDTVARDNAMTFSRILIKTDDKIYGQSNERQSKQEKAIRITDDRKYRSFFLAKLSWTRQFWMTPYYVENQLCFESVSSEIYFTFLCNVFKHTIFSKIQNKNWPPDSKTLHERLVYNVKTRPPEGVFFFFL